MKKIVCEHFKRENKLIARYARKIFLVFCPFLNDFAEHDKD
jgi:hypothetical protein